MRHTDHGDCWICGRCGRHFKSAGAKNQHDRRMHPIIRPPRSTPRRWCRGSHGGRTKQYFGTIHAAWIRAFELFSRTGVITTPYRCSSIKTQRPFVIRKHHLANPWAFDVTPVGAGLSSPRASQGHCNGYHLTKATDHMLIAWAQ